MYNFLLIFVANPIVNTLLVVINDNYEWYNDFDKDTSEEKEIAINFEDESIQYYFKNQFIFYSETSQRHLYFKNTNALQNFNFDILLPPPELL